MSNVTPRPSMGEGRLPELNKKNSEINVLKNMVPLTESQEAYVKS